MSSENEKPDVEAIMERIREQVRASVATDRASYPRYSPPSTKESNSGSALIESDELSYLNAHWHDWMLAEDVVSHRPIIGRFIVRAKRFVIDAVWHYVLKGYLAREKQFQMQLVRHLNTAAQHVDKRDYDNFWQLIKKIDNDVTALNERMDFLFNRLHSQVSFLETEFEQKTANGRS
jgi:hypothetical protein